MFQVCRDISKTRKIGLLLLTPYSFSPGNKIGTPLRASECLTTILRNNEQLLYLIHSPEALEKKYKVRFGSETGEGEQDNLIKAFVDQLVVSCCSSALPLISKSYFRKTLREKIKRISDSLLKFARLGIRE